MKLHIFIPVIIITACSGNKIGENSIVDSTAELTTDTIAIEDTVKKTLDLAKIDAMLCL